MSNNVIRELYVIDDSLLDFLLFIKMVLWKGMKVAYVTAVLEVTGSIVGSD